MKNIHFPSVRKSLHRFTVSLDRDKLLVMKTRRWLYNTRRQISCQVSMRISMHL